MVTRRGASTNYDASADQTGTHAQEPHPFNANHTFCISSTVPSCNNSNHHSRSNSDVATTVPPLILLSAIHPNSSTTQNATSSNATTGSSSISCKRYRGVRNMMGLFAMSFGYAFVSTTMFTLLVPREIERLRPHRTSLWLGMLMGISALCQMTSPLFGAWSDRVARRGFFLFLGTTISIIGVGMFLSLSFYEAWGGRTILAVLLLFTGSATLTIGLTAQYAIVTSLLSDCVVEDQVGKGSGVLAVLTFLGSGVGYGLFALKASPESLYMMFVSVSALCFLITWHNLPATLDTYLAHRKMIRFSESSHTSHIVSPSSNRSKSAMQYHHYITPHLLTPKRGWCRNFIDLIQHAYVFPDMMEHRDFFYACAARALFNVGLSAQVFLVYYYRDIMNETDPLHVLSYVCVAVLFGSVIAALPSGILSDSIGKKPLIYFSVSLCITCVILFVTSRSVTAHLYIAVLYGIGNVAFLSLDYALGVQTLPRPVPSTNYNQNQSSPTQTYPLNCMDPNLITEHTGLMTSNPMEVVESPERAASAYGMDLHGCNGTVHRSHTLVAHAHSVSSTSAITEPRDSGKDLGIFSMSSTIGQLIGQVMYGLLLDSFRIEGAATTSTNSIPSLPGTLGDGANDTSHYFYEGFLFVYACCCISFASAGVCVYRIRGVK